MFERLFLWLVRHGHSTTEKIIVASCSLASSLLGASHYDAHYGGGKNLRIH